MYRFVSAAYLAACLASPAASGQKALFEDDGKLPPPPRSVDARVRPAAATPT